MIERALKIKSQLAHLVSNHQTLINNWLITEEEWEILNDLLELLALFALITKVISALSYPTISEVKWLFLEIKNQLEKSRSDYNLQAQVDEMKRIFNNYFEQFNKSLHIPAFFDPKYKKISYRNMTQEDILRPIQKAMADYGEIPSPPPILLKIFLHDVNLLVYQLMKHEDIFRIYSCLLKFSNQQLLIN